MKIAFGFDLHNTILLSNDAWIDALSECSEEKYKNFIRHEVYNKTSRKMIAAVSYTHLDVYKRQSIHIGNFRDIATSLFVVRALERKGKKARLLFSWDEYDRLRKVPVNVEKATDRCV